MAVEARLLFYSKDITSCIKDPRVISYLEADLIIPHDECSRLKSMHLDGKSTEANDMMINSLQKSTAKGKWQSFLNALENSEYGYIKSLLETEGKPNVKGAHEKAIIRVFTPYLETTVVPMEIVTELYSRKVLNDTDVELIQAIYQKMGNRCAITVLLDRMQCRVAPNEWYYKFLDVLRHKNLEHIVKEIEPDFLICPEQFRQSKEMNNEGEQEMTCDGEEPTSSTFSDVQEHILADYGEADEKMDESVPEPFEDDFEKNTDDLPVDLTMKEKSPNSSGICEKNKTSNTQDNLLYTSQREDMYTTRTLKSASFGTRQPPEGRDVDCKDSVGTDKMQTINKPGISNNSTHLETKTYKGSDELVGSNNDISQETKSDLEHDTKPLVERLYPFQHELAEKALAGKNTIICAPTGSGKTWVATYIIGCHLKSIDIGKTTRRVAFMARNGVLVKQQMEFISMELPQAKVKHIEGNTEESMMVNAFLEDYDIFFFTPQILVNNLNSDIQSISVFSLLIFDECHHTKGNEPYNVLMRHYMMEKSKGNKGLPQIVGLTASIGTGRAKSESDALDHIFRVCASLDVRCLSTVEKHKEDLTKHTSVPREEKLLMKNRPTDPCRSILLEAVKRTADVLKDLALMEPTLIPVMFKCPKDLEAKGYEIWIASAINAAESLSGPHVRDITTCAKYVQIYYNALEINRLLRTMDISLYLAKKHEADAQNSESLTNKEASLLKSLKDVQKELTTVESENPNVHVISEIIKRLFTGKDADLDSRVMVFVHARATCRALADFLNTELSDVYVQASPFIGKETRGTDKGMTEEEQTQVLNEFKEGTFKVLVATSIGMEGLDVPDCNMTLNYNFNGNEITKIQMSGRSRKENGKEVQIGNETHFAKDTIVMYRIKLMNSAIEKFKTLDRSSINRKILAEQKKMLDDFTWDLKVKEMKRSKQSDENDYEIHCRRCDTFICNCSDLRQLDTSILVALKNFDEKIKKTTYEKRGNMGVLQKKFKMFCKHCPNDLGVIAIKNDIEYFILKLIRLKFICNSDHKSVTVYKKWSDMPYKPKELTTRDLDDIYHDSQ